MDHSTFQQLPGHGTFAQQLPQHHFQQQHQKLQQLQLQRLQSLQHQQLNQELSHRLQSQHYQSPHPQNASVDSTMYQSGIGQPGASQQVSQGQSVSHGAFAVQPYGSWGTGSVLNMTTSRRPRPQAIHGPPNDQHFAMNTHADGFRRPQSIESNQWTQKVANPLDVAAYNPKMTDISRPVSRIDPDNNLIDIAQMGSYEKEGNSNKNQPFQHEIESRRPSQVSDSTYATTRLTTPDMTYPSDSDWSSAERPKSLQQPTFSPMDSPSTGPLRPGSKSRASPVPHNQMRASPYTLESNRRLRWSTGMNVPSQTPLRAAYQYNNRYSSQFGYSPLNPHNGLTSVSNEAGVTTFAAPGQSLAYSQRMSAGGHFMLHPGYADTPHQLASQSLFPLIPSDRLHAYGGHFADLSDPPDLFASLSEAPCDPPEEDMNPSDPEMVPHEQELRFTGDLYTPRWVRGQGNKREGWCGLCKPGRWLVLKNSAYWYDKSFTHGVCAQTGAAFAAPDATRRVEGNADAWEGLCGQCGEWLSLVSSKKKGPTTWFRHVSKCHVSHKPKDIPKRRRGTIKRPPLTTVGSDGEVLHAHCAQGNACADDCVDDHRDVYSHQHGSEYDQHAAQHEQAEQQSHLMFNGDFNGGQSLKSLLSPPPISPKTLDQKRTAIHLQSESSSTSNSTAVPAEFGPEDHQDAQQSPSSGEAPIKMESISAAPQVDSSEDSTEDLDTMMRDDGSNSISCADLMVPNLALSVTKSELCVETHEMAANAPPSPDLTPISTPQLSETSLSTPQMETPTHNFQSLVGLGVQGVHIMTGIPEHSAHDINLDDLSQLEALYGGGSNSEDSPSNTYTCDTQQPLESTRDNQDYFDNQEPDEIPLPLSATDNICMSSQFDMTSAYSEHQIHEMRPMSDYSHGVLGLHMDMRMLDHDSGHFNGLNESNLIDSYNGMI